MAALVSGEAQHGELLSALTLGLLFFFFVNGYRIQIFCFKNLTAIEATEVIDSVATVKEFGPLVLTTWHSEVSLILVCSVRLSSLFESAAVFY